MKNGAKTFPHLYNTCSTTKNTRASKRLLRSTNQIGHISSKVKLLPPPAILKCVKYSTDVSKRMEYEIKYISVFLTIQTEVQERINIWQPARKDWRTLLTYSTPTPISSATELHNSGLGKTKLSIGRFSWKSPFHR